MKRNRGANMETQVEIRKALFRKAAREVGQYLTVKSMGPCHYCGSMTTESSRLCSETCQNEWEASCHAPELPPSGGVE
jgi:hypothetical protein